jgi:hypothetical protein
VNDSFRICGGIRSSVTRNDSVSQLDGLLRGLRLVEEDEVPVVRQPFVGVEPEAADVEGQTGGGDLHAYVQIRARGQVTDPGLVAALELPGHAQRPSPIRIVSASGQANGKVRHRTKPVRTRCTITVPR